MEDNRLKSRNGRFWCCPGGHTETFIPFEDVLKPGPGRAARACKVCHIGMQLVTWYWDKAGQLIDPPVIIRRKVQYDESGNQIVKSIERRIVSPRAVIRRLLRRLRKYEPISHYRKDKVGVVTVAISRVGEEPLPSNGQVYEKRHIILVSSPAVPMAVGITMVGVHGWLEDVKHAVKKAKLYITDISSRECSVVPPPKVVNHRRVYKHTYPNKYLPRNIAMLGKNVADISKVSVFTSRDGKVLEGKELEQAFSKKAAQIAKTKKLKLTPKQFKQVVKESQRLLRQSI